MRKLKVALLSLFVILLLGFFVRTPIPAGTPAITIVTPTGTQVLGQMTKNSGCTESNGLPDGACTPGEADSRVTQENIQSTICVSGYSASVRPATSVTNKIKVERMAAYGDTDGMSNYELDHLISLELGGCPDCVSNLWPEPYNGTAGAHAKDTVENYLHKEVCTGAMNLEAAQKVIAHDWESVYNALPNK